jgi:hypothetical protein
VVKVWSKSPDEKNTKSEQLEKSDYTHLKRLIFEGWRNQSSNSQGGRLHLGVAGLPAALSPQPLVVSKR